MNYNKMSRKFTCACGKTGYTIHDDVTQCRTCKPKKAAFLEKKCACGNVFYSSVGKEKCKKCALEDLKVNNPIEFRRRMNKLAKRNCYDINHYKDEIKLLFIKREKELLNFIDIFRICHIWMEVTCDEYKWAGLNPLLQANSMILELFNMSQWTGPIPQRGNPVVKIDSDGNMLEKYASVTEAARVNGIYKEYITRSCNRVKSSKFKKLQFRWFSDYNIYINGRIEK